MIRVEFAELPENMPLKFLKETVDLNIERVEPILFVVNKQIETSKKQQKVYYRAMKSMASKDPGFCFRMGELKCALDEEIKANEITKELCEDYIQTMYEVKKDIAKG